MCHSLKRTMISLAFLCALVSQMTAQSTGPSVVTSQGTVVGATAPDGSYFVFYGIPYAGSVSGVNRFKEAPAAPNFPGTYHAMDYGKTCAQPSANGLVGEEDCLVLNIFTQEVTAPKPVIVFIDGEDYTTATNNHLYSFKTLVEQNVVVVTINYRLSVFGFLCLGVDQAPGNAGLKDVIAGLRWIQQNIAGFGGNPNNVVLFGHGAGAAMVDLITLSPQGHNLVHKAIVSSGSALAPWAVAYDPVGYAESLGAKLGYTDKTREELAKALAETDLSVLINALGEYESYNNTAMFAPCIEDSRRNDTFLADVPINILRSTNFTSIPFLTGYVNREGTVRAQQALHGTWLAGMQANFSNFLQADLGFPNLATRTTVARNVSDFYFGNATINLATVEDFLDYQGDSMFLVSIIRSVRERVASSAAGSVFLYEFAYRGTQNTEFPYNIPLTGAKHGDVKNYLFNYDLRASDVNISADWIRRWVAFANNGNPNPSSPMLVNWPAAAAASTPYLHLYSSEPSPNGVASVHEISASNPHSQRMAFWADLYDRYYEAPRPVSAGDKVLSFALAVLVCQAIVGILY